MKVAFGSCSYLRSPCNSWLLLGDDDTYSWKACWMLISELNGFPRGNAEVLISVF